MLIRSTLLALVAAVTLGTTALVSTPSEAQSMRRDTMIYRDGTMMQRDGMRMRNDNGWHRGQMMKRCKMVRERTYDRRMHRYVWRTVRVCR